MWLHSSPTDLAVGAEVLPPTVTGKRPRTFAPDENYRMYSWYRDDRVYVSRIDGSDPLQVLGTMPWNQPNTYLYEVDPADIEHDGDVVAAPAGSHSCAKAVVARRIYEPVKAAGTGSTHDG
ncbi:MULTISPECIES: hypothetical protein [Flexivirga]|nr:MULTISPECIES: hypothetical protein [Flexivirga]